ncbi:DUF721 domain-containing protein [Paralimibaculum aggregatum]|uniref:DUF721 domain-containing protein n=1 Tax=Paralimibaculum aggregatum TaxID=3036245 RepID=A0ABQ6LKP1_9RHOB|nr:DUF721 domain-containing protein [Limibaculum sp. NKW23]GMG82976.1 DUF721 domain-containing protein [Limibaculum sp. NKW23]
MSEPRGQRPRRREFRQIGAGLSRRMVETAAKRGFAEPEVLMRWPEIVGAALAPSCRPVKVRFGAAPSLGATLVVEVVGARGPEVELSAPQILERINQYYGYRAVSRLKVVQTGTAGFAEAQAAFRGHPGEDDETATTAAARAEAERLVAGIRSPGLRKVMARLGALVLSRAGHTP